MQWRGSMLLSQPLWGWPPACVPCLLQPHLDCCAAPPLPGGTGQGWRGGQGAAQSSHEGGWGGRLLRLLSVLRVAEAAESWLAAADSWGLITGMEWKHAAGSEWLITSAALSSSLPPARLLQEMGVNGLTRENVASHLQKHRMRLKKDEDGEGGGGGGSGHHTPMGSGRAARVRPGQGRLGWGRVQACLRACACTRAVGVAGAP